MADQEHGTFLYIAEEKGADKTKIGITTSIERRNASLGPKVTILRYVETPYHQEWEALIKDLLNNLAIPSGKTSEGTASKDTEWFTVNPERLEPLLDLIASEQGNSLPETETDSDLTPREAEALEHLEGGKSQADTARAMEVSSVYWLVRSLRNKGYMR